MTAQDYIQTKLNDLGSPLGLSKINGDKEIVDAIVKALTSKKFRKYHLSPENADIIKSSIALNVANKQPIKATLVFGGYKLWRLAETPEVDWAELFSLMYYTNWVKPICEVYEPGIWFDFFSDDVIVPKINNISPNDTKAYQQSFKELLKFIKPYQPKNLNMTLHRVGDQYQTAEEFEADLKAQIKDVASKLEGGLPVLDDVARSTLDLNVQEPGEDPQWREKTQLIHDSYMQVKGRRPYYRVPDKFSIMTTPLNGMLSVGTTKDSIMKFWVGTGVLKPKDGSYRQVIFSPNQIKKAQFNNELVSIAGLSGKNFHKIRVLEDK